MVAGILNEIIEVYEPNVVINDYGEQTTVDVLKYRTRARVQHNNGNRTLENGSEIVYPYNKTFEVRIYLDIKDFDKIKWNDKYYKILDITPNRHFQNLVISTELINE